MKKCSKCGEINPLCEFHKRNDRKTTLCEECHNKAHIEIGCRYVDLQCKIKGR